MSPRPAHSIWEGWKAAPSLQVQFLIINWSKNFTCTGSAVGTGASLLISHVEVGSSLFVQANWTFHSCEVGESVTNVAGEQVCIVHRLVSGRHHVGLIRIQIPSTPSSRSQMRGASQVEGLIVPALCPYSLNSAMSTRFLLRSADKLACIGCCTYSSLLFLLFIYFLYIFIFYNRTMRKWRSEADKTGHGTHFVEFVKLRGCSIIRNQKVIS